MARVPEAQHLYVAMTTEPARDDGTLATSLHVARVVAVDDAGGRTAVHYYAEDGAAVVALTLYVAFVTYILECHPATAVRSTYDTANELVAHKGVARTGDEVLDIAATIDHAEDTNSRRADIHNVVNHVILSVKGTDVTTLKTADGYKILAVHVDVGSEYCIGVVLATIHDVGKLNQFVGSTNLVDAIHFV